MPDKIPNFSEVSEDICWQYPKFQLEYPVLKTLWSRPSLSIDIVTSIFMSILRRSTPNSSHHMVVHGSSRLSDNTLLLWDQVVGDRLCWFLPTKSTQKLRNTLVSVYYEKNSHRTAMNYGSRSALLDHNWKLLLDFKEVLKINDLIS